MNPRRLVTGHDPDGKSIVVSDDVVAPVTLGLLPGFEWHALSGSDGTVTLPNDGSEVSAPAYFPPVGGYRFMFFMIPPDGVSPVNEDLDLDAAIAEFEVKLPGMAAHMEPENPGMHTTTTVDCGIVVAGEITLELDDGATYTVRTGDTYVQNGTRHRWSNAGDIPAVIAASQSEPNTPGCRTSTGRGQVPHTGSALRYWWPGTRLLAGASAEELVAPATARGVS